MVHDQILIRISMAQWVKRLQVEREPGWETRIQTIYELLAILGVNLDGFDEQVEKANYNKNWRKLKGLE